MSRLFILYLLMPAVCFAQPDTEELPPMIIMPDMPEPIKNNEEMSADITIIRREKKTIQEFRRKGKLYMVKVTPDVGPPYYFMDTDGDGTLEVRRSDLDRKQKIHQWKLLEWN